MNSHRRTRVLTVAPLAMVLLLVGCSSGPKSKTSSSTTATTSAAASSTTVSVITNAKLGPIVADSGGHTLYVFDGDTPGKIGCTGACATLWLPVVLELGQNSPSGMGVSVPLGTVDRPEGPQVTLGGRPLYTYTMDGNMGDTNGDGIGGKWHVAKPDGNPVGQGPAATSGTAAHNTTTSSTSHQTTTSSTHPTTTTTLHSTTSTTA